jgi:hypothetical protein
MFLESKTFNVQRATLNVQLSKSNGGARMSTVSTAPTVVRPAWLRWLCSAENGLTVVVLALPMILPLLEALARKVPSLAVA